MYGLQKTYATPKVVFYQGKSDTAKQAFLESHSGVVKNHTNNGCLYTAESGEELLEVDRAGRHFVLRVPVTRVKNYQGTRLSRIR